jgi:hypothetical protein
VNDKLQLPVSQGTAAGQVAGTKRRCALSVIEEGEKEREKERQMQKEGV